MIAKYRSDPLTNIEGLWDCGVVNGAGGIWFIVGNVVKVAAAAAAAAAAPRGFPTTTVTIAATESGSCRALNVRNKRRWWRRGRGAFPCSTTGSDKRSLLRLLQQSAHQLA